LGLIFGFDQNISISKFLAFFTTPPTVTSLIFFSVNGETFARESSLLLSDRAIIRYFPSGAGGRFQGGQAFFRLQLTTRRFLATKTVVADLNC